MDYRMWDAIISTRASLLKVRIDTDTATVKEVARMPNVHNTHVVEQAAETRTARAVLGFARFPITRVQMTANGYRVTFMDFRFYDEVTHRSFAAAVELDESLNVTNEALAFNEQIE